jgi:hypothetical protein
VDPAGEPGRINRRPGALTDEELERHILQSTPKGQVAGRELHIDLSLLNEAAFHTVGRLIGAIEGFLRRGGSVRVSPPPSRATADESRRLAQPTTPQTQEALRRSRVDLAHLVQARSRARRFLERVSFLPAAQCSHLGDSHFSIEPSPELSSEREPAEIRVEPSPLADRGELIEVVPFRWMRLSSKADLIVTTDQISSALTAIGVSRQIRGAVEELTQNVFEHSLYGDTTLQSVAPPHMLFGAALRETVNGRRLELLVVDGGVGIPNTLKSAYRKAHQRNGNQSEVVAYAFAPSSTRKREVEGSARGLAVVLAAVRGAGGSMIVRSGSGEALLRDGEVVPCEPRDGTQLGTSYALSIPLDLPRPPRPPGQDAEHVEPGSLDVEVHLLRSDGTSSRLLALGPATPPPTHELSVLFVEPGCRRVDLERTLDRQIRSSTVVFVASTDGQGTLLQDQIEAISAARSEVVLAEVLVLDGLEPVRVHGTIEPRAARGLVRATVTRFHDFVTEVVGDMVAEVPLQPRRTWSLEIAPRWIEPQSFVSEPLLYVLTPMVLAFETAQRLAAADSSERGDLVILDVVITDKDFGGLGNALAGWLGASHVRRVAVPQEPDGALLADEIEAASVVLTSVIHGGGATVPVIRGLLAGGRQSIAVCCIVDGRIDCDRGLLVAGHELPVIAALTSSLGTPDDSVAVLEDEALDQIQLMLDGDGGDSAFYDAVANSPGALSLGHFHSENRAWMSAIVAPSAIADPTTEVGQLIVERLSHSVRAEAEALCPGAPIAVQDLADSTQLTVHLRRSLAAYNREATTNELVTVLVDWGALTGDTAVRGALGEAGQGSSAVIVAVGVDRAYRGAHHLLSRSAVTVTAAPRGKLFGEDGRLEAREVRISFLGAAEFPRDHRSEVDCPLCATERSLLRLRSMPTASLNSRLRILRARTANEPARSETVDAFECPMPSAEVRRFLIWREIVHRGIDEPVLAHGVALRLEGRMEGLPAADIIALARNLVLNPDLLRRRPWSSPRFRHALADAVAEFLVSNEGLSISSDMARQLVTVLRMASKMGLARRAGTLYLHWKSADVREELELALATTLRENMSGALLESVAASVAEFEAGWPEEVPISLGALKADIARMRASRRGDRSMQTRWRKAHEMLANLRTHMGLGGANARLPIVIANLHEPEAVEKRNTLFDSAIRSVREIDRFISLSYPSICAHIEAEVNPLVARGAAEQLPDRDSWLANVRELTRLLDTQRAAIDHSAAVDSSLHQLAGQVLAPLDDSPESKTFAGLVLAASADVGRAVAAVIQRSESASCVILGPEHSAHVLFPEPILHDLITHLVANGSKYHRDDAPPSEIRFELLPLDEDVLYHHLRVSYRNTDPTHPVNPIGGLSDSQWGGAVAAFGGAIEILPVLAGESFALEVLLQRPWGEAS